MHGHGTRAVLRTGTQRMAFATSKLSPPVTAPRARHGRRRVVSGGSVRPRVKTKGVMIAGPPRLESEDAFAQGSRAGRRSPQRREHTATWPQRNRGGANGMSERRAFMRHRVNKTEQRTASALNRQQSG